MRSIKTLVFAAFVCLATPASHDSFAIDDQEGPHKHRIHEVTHMSEAEFEYDHESWYDLDKVKSGRELHE